MATLDFKSFNGFALFIDNKLIQHFYSQKAKALLIYLASEFPRQHERSHLAGLLWPDFPETRAKRNLSQTFASLRKDLGDAKYDTPFFTITTQTIGLNPNLNLTADVLVLKQTLQFVREHNHSNPKQCVACTTKLQTAVSLYPGPFLDQFGTVDSPLFEEWIIIQREQFTQQAVEIMGRLGSQLEAQQRFDAALQVNERLLTLSPWLESAHQLQMRLFAHQGQRIQALNQYEQLSDVLMRELGVAPSEETDALYDAIMAGVFKANIPSEATQFGKGTDPKQTSPKPEFHGPTMSTLVGRQEELDIIISQFKDPDIRLMSLIGPGGIGKTHLAIEAAKQLVELSELFEDGAYFVDLAATETAVQFITQIASALDLSFSGIVPPKAQLKEQLQRKRSLVVLDNFEQLIEEGANAIGELLADTSSIRFLITSREPLNLVEEWQVKIEGLAYPEETAVFPQDTPYLQLVAPNKAEHTYPSVTLFINRAKQVEPKFSLESADTELAVMQVCNLLEGYPLGIELAAPWVRLMSCQEIVKEIKNSIDILASRQRNILPRHRSIRAVFEQSWRQLTAVEQALLANLSVFNGPFRREAVTQICQTSLFDLVTLVDKSLLQTHPNQTYRMHRLLQQFAAEKLSQQVSQVVRSDHAKYYANHLKALESDLGGAKQTLTLNKIESELENIKLAWYWLIENNQIEDLTKSFYTIYSFHSIRGRTLEGKELFETAVHHFTNTFDDQLALNSPAIALFAFLHARLGQFYYALGQLSKAEVQFQESIHHNRQIQSTQELALCYYMLGNTKRLLGYFAAAQNWLLEALAILDVKKEAHTYGFALMTLGAIEKELGNNLEAKAYLNQSKEQFEKLQYQFGLAHILRHLGTIAILENDLTQAQEYIVQSLHISREIGTKGGEAMALNQLGKLQQLSGDYESAQMMYQTGLTLGTESQESIVQIRTMKSLGVLKNEKGNYEEANAYLLQALRKSAKAEAIPEALHIIVEMAKGYVLQGRADQALPLMQLALQHPASSRETVEDAHRIQQQLPQTISTSQQEINSGLASNMLNALLEKSIHQK